MLAPRERLSFVPRRRKQMQISHHPRPPPFPPPPEVQFYVSENWNSQSHFEDKFNLNALLCALLCHFASIMSSLMRPFNAKSSHYPVKRSEKAANRNYTNEELKSLNDKTFLLHSISGFFLFIYAPLYDYNHCRCKPNASGLGVGRENCESFQRFGAKRSESNKIFMGKLFVNSELAFSGFADANSKRSTTRINI